MLWLKVDANLDHHPKIRAAGFWGSVVFQALLRINKANMLNGTIPPAFASPEHVAYVTGLDRAQGLADAPVDLVLDGIDGATRAGLLRQDGAGTHIVGWAEEWGKVAKTGAERTAEWRQRKRDGVTNGDGVTSLGHDVTCDGRSEEKRSEEKRSHTTRARVGEIPTDAQLEKTALQIAHELFIEQERLRQEIRSEGIDRSAPALGLAAGRAQLEACGLLAAAEGFRSEQLHHCLRVRAAEARATRSLARFDGTVNWSPGSISWAIGHSPDEFTPKPTSPTLVDLSAEYKRMAGDDA